MKHKQNIHHFFPDFLLSSKLLLTPMLARALQADPDSVGDRDPLRVEGATLETFLNEEISHYNAIKHMK